MNIWKTFSISINFTSFNHPPLSSRFLFLILDLFTAFTDAVTEATPLNDESQLRALYTLWAMNSLALG